MKGKNLQTRILYPGRLLFRFHGEIKSFTDKQMLKRVQNHPTSFIRNVEGTPLSEKVKATTRNMKVTKGKIS